MMLRKWLGIMVANIWSDTTILCQELYEDKPTPVFEHWMLLMLLLPHKENNMLAFWLYSWKELDLFLKKKKKKKNSVLCTHKKR